jgi:hypothetical protein
MQYTAFIVTISLGHTNRFMKMSTKHLKQCQLCLRWHSTRTGTYTKHIKTCRHSDQRDPPIGIQNLMSKNPLLSLMSEDIPYNNDYHCDLFDDLATVELNDSHNDTNQSDDCDDSSNQSSDAHLTHIIQSMTLQPMIRGSFQIHGPHNLMQHKHFR